MVKWVRDDLTSTSMWKSLISEVVTGKNWTLYQWRDSCFSAEMEETDGIPGRHI